MKFTQKACSIKLPKTKSANALSLLILVLPSSMISPVTPSIVFVGPPLVAFLLVEAVEAKPGGGRSVVCNRKEMVSTNCPAARQKEERKALNG